MSPLGLGSRRLPLADVWLEYVKSPDRRDLAPSTLNAKRLVWMDFARWMEHHHLEIGNLAEVTHEAIAEYLACIRAEDTTLFRSAYKSLPNPCSFLPNT